MAKNEGMIIAGAIIVAVLLLGQQGDTPPTQVTNGGGIDLCALVDGQASFTGQNMYLAGTAVTTEYVRVLRQGSIMDLGQISTNSGTVALTPGATYKLYYGENSTTYYTGLETYNAPCQDATDDKVARLCTMDTAPTLTIYNENGQVVTGASTDVTAIAADEVVDVEVKIKAAADKCFGNPDAPNGNAICFKYNSTYYTNVKTDTPAISTPYNISNILSATGYAISCYDLPKVADTDSVIIPVTIEATSTDPNGGVAGANISVIIDDIAFDLNADNLEEIWGFEDEDNNALGVPTIIGSATTGTISVS